MRTTPTLEEDRAEALSQAASGTADRKPFVVEPQSCGWMPGIDPLRRNPLVDDLESETWLIKQAHGEEKEEE